MNHLDHLWLKETQALARQSPDPSTKVGALFTDESGTHRLGSGFNHFPPGVPATAEHYADRAYKYKYIRHAEVWAGIEALEGNQRHLVHGSQLYTSFTCCPQCARFAIGLGVSRIIFPPLNVEGRPAEWVKQWRGWRDETMDILSKAGVRVSIRNV